MKSIERQPTLVRLMRRLEDAKALDGPVQAIDPTIRMAFGSGARGAALPCGTQGRHPAFDAAALH